MRLRLVPFLLVAALVTGCGGGDDDADDDREEVERDETTTTEADEDTTTTTESSDGDDADDDGSDDDGDTGESAITVLDPGEEPRVELRYDLEAGSEQRFVAVNAITQSVNGQSGGTLTTRNLTVATVDSVDDGVATVQIEYVDATIEGSPDTPPEAIEGGQIGLDAIEGIQIELELDERGSIRSSEVVQGPSTDAGSIVQTLLEQLLSSIEQLVYPLPDEAVGIGVEWTTSLELEVLGLVTTLSSDIVVTGLGDGFVELAISQEVELEGEAEGSGTGSGTVRIDLDSPVPLSTLVSDATVESAGITLVQHIETSVVLTD